MVFLETTEEIQEEHRRNRFPKTGITFCILAVDFPNNLSKQLKLVIMFSKEEEVYRYPVAVIIYFYSFDPKKHNNLILLLLKDSFPLKKKNQ